MYWLMLRAILSILVQQPSIVLVSRLVIVQVSDPYRSTDSTVAVNRRILRSLRRSDFHTAFKLYSNSRIFVIPVYIFNGRRQTLVDTIEILSALRMRGLHDKRHLLAKLRNAGSENCSFGCFLNHIICFC